MDYGFGTEGYYKKMLELQERLRKSEEERLKLEEKFNEMMHVTRDVEHDRLRLMRHRYHKFLEEDKNRQERNENILRALDRIESRAKMLSAKTTRFKAFRKQYDSYIKRIYQTKTEQQPSYRNTSPSQPDRSYTHSNVRKKLFSDLPTKDESVEGKLAMLEQYLRDNFENFPREPAAKSKNNHFNGNEIFNENGHDANIAQHQRDSFYNPNNFDRQRYFEPLDSDSKESQEVNDDYNKFSDKQQKYSPQEETKNKMPPTKSELLGNTIEKELERLKRKEPIKQISIQKENSFEVKEPEKVIQDYKDLVSKSEEKYGLRGESPIRNSKNAEEKKDLSKEIINNPTIFDNVSKTVNINELKNIAGMKENPDKITEKNESKSNNILQDKEDSESENPVIKNYKKMLKSFEEDIIPSENNLNLNQDLKNSSPNIQENIIEHSKQDDNSERTEPPTDISLNLSSQKEEPIPIDQTKTEQNKQNEAHLEENKNNSIKTNQINKNSVDESTIKEQLHINSEKEQNKLSDQLESSNQSQENENPQNIKQPKEFDTQNYQSQEILGEKVYNEYPQEINEDKEQPVYKEQNYVGETRNQPYQEENILTQQQKEQQQKEQQQKKQPQKEQQPAYQEGFEDSQQNVTDQPEYQEGYDMTQQPDYQEGYEMSQDINQQPQYPEGYDGTQQNITDPNYQEGYDAQYYAQQGEAAQDGYNNQQYAEGQPMYQEGYEQQYPPEQQQEGYDPQQEGYDPQQQEGYDPQQQQEGYDPQQQQEGYDPQQQEGYDPQQQQQGYDPQQQEGYDPQQQQEGYDPQQQEGYDPQQQQEGYNPQQQEGYDPQQYQEYTDQGYQPQEYPQEFDAQQYPQEGQVSENIYQSEQEYIQGEQNIDKQYESEQNQEYQPQEYPENYTEQEQSQLKSEQDNVNVSDSTGKSSSPNDVVDNKPIVEKTMPNL